MAVLHFPDVEHRWAYSALVDFVHDKHEPVADDPAFICGLTGLSRKTWATVREYLVERDNNRCVYCGSADQLTADHRVPWSRGGITHPCNLATACLPCNMSKGNRTPEEWRA